RCTGCRPSCRTRWPISPRRSANRSITGPPVRPRPGRRRWHDGAARHRPPGDSPRRRRDLPLPLPPLPAKAAGLSDALERGQPGRSRHGGRSDRRARPRAARGSRPDDGGRPGSAGPDPDRDRDRILGGRLSDRAAVSNLRGLGHGHDAPARTHRGRLGRARRRGDPVSVLVGLPIALPLGTALLALLFPRPSTARRFGVVAVLAFQLGFSVWLLETVMRQGPLVLALGGWEVPYGIVLLADTLSAIMLGLSSLTALACVLYGFAESLREHEHPLRVPLLLLLVAGIHLAFLTGDLFTLFVAFEVFLLASYGLMTLQMVATRT